MTSSLNKRNSPIKMDPRAHKQSPKPEPNNTSSNDDDHNNNNNNNNTTDRAQTPSDLTDTSYISDYTDTTDTPEASDAYDSSDGYSDTPNTAMGSDDGGFWYNRMFDCRSDGKTEIVVKKRGRRGLITIPNRPSDKQLDPTPNEKGELDYYVECDLDHPKSVDWRLKLAAWLWDRKGVEEQKKVYRNSCMLDGFPPGYRLYEHVKTTVDPETGEVVKSNDDRQDAYLYGHPGGPKKRYRSPKDFLLHFIWLTTCSDEDFRDPETCNCKICCPVELEEVSAWWEAHQAELAAKAAKAGKTGDGGEREELRSEPSNKGPTQEVPAKAAVKRHPSGSLKSKASASTSVPASKPSPPTTVPTAKASSSTSVPASKASSSSSALPTGKASSNSASASKHSSSNRATASKNSSASSVQTSRASSSTQVPTPTRPKSVGTSSVGNGTSSLVGNTASSVGNGPSSLVSNTVPPVGNGPSSLVGNTASSVRTVSSAVANVPTPLLPFRCAEQEVDARYGQFIFRPGELVWFNRSTSAWGLALVLQRQGYQGSQIQAEPRYLIQPLSHPYGRPPAGVYSESSIRPYLTWSAPEPTHEALRADGLTYDTIDWQAVIQRMLGPGDDEVDGSIFAARAVDASYTLFHPIPAPPTAIPGETYWNGIFIGAEKVWVGEAVRLRIGIAGVAVMVIHYIIERTHTGFGGGNGNNGPSTMKTVFLMGDIYSFSTINITDPSNVPIIENNPHLPIRLVKDLDFHNAKTRYTQMTISNWKLIQSPHRLTLAEIKGRWYESSILLPLLRGKEVFEQDAAKGEIGEAGMWMNARFDQLCPGGGVSQPPNSDLVGIRKETREEAFGCSIPPNTRVSLGIEGPAHQDNSNTVFNIMGSSITNPIILASQEATASQGNGVNNNTMMTTDSNPIHGVNEVEMLDESNIEQFMDLDQDPMIGGVGLDDDSTMTVGEHFFGVDGHAGHGAH